MVIDMEHPSVDEFKLVERESTVGVRHTQNRERISEPDSQCWGVVSQAGFLGQRDPDEAVFERGSVKHTGSRPTPIKHSFIQTDRQRDWYAQEAICIGDNAMYTHTH